MAKKKDNAIDIQIKLLVSIREKREEQRKNKKEEEIKIEPIVFGYSRCSTDEERQDIERQSEELQEQGVEVSLQEYGSGAKEDRDILNELLETMEAGDTLITLEVSRLSRSLQHLLKIIDMVEKKQLRLVIQNSITIDCRGGKKIDAMTQAFLQISGVFAELERNMISARVKSGMEKAKRDGSRIGRKTTTIESIPDIFFKYYELYEKGKINKSDFSRLAGLSRPSVRKYIEIVENTKKAPPVVDDASNGK